MNRRVPEITSKSAYEASRRVSHGAFVGGALALAGAAVVSDRVLDMASPSQLVGRGDKLPNVQPSNYKTDETKTPYKDITTYNNFYEFGTDKGDPARNAGTLKTRPWTVSIEGRWRSRRRSTWTR